MKGKCPKCDKLVTHVSFEGIAIRVPFGTGGWRGVSYFCPWCNTVLAVGADPVSLKSEIVSEVGNRIDEVKRGLNRIGDMLNRIAHLLNSN